jgi:hypothetical protein
MKKKCIGYPSEHCGEGLVARRAILDVWNIGHFVGEGEWFAGRCFVSEHQAVLQEIPSFSYFKMQ